MADLSDFQQYYKLADVLIQQASKDQLAECARLLALKLAHYQGMATTLDRLKGSTEEVHLLAAFRSLPKERQLIAIKLVEALK